MLKNLNGLNGRGFGFFLDKAELYPDSPSTDVFLLYYPVSIADIIGLGDSMIIPRFKCVSLNLF